MRALPENEGGSQKKEGSFLALLHNCTRQFVIDVALALDVPRTYAQCGMGAYLDRPKTAKHSARGECRVGERAVVYASTAVQGWRVSMEVREREREGGRERRIYPGAPPHVMARVLHIIHVALCSCAVDYV